ncbi:MAG TPA: hypothetical protein VGL09_06315 [Methylomirabilota bacterium]
MILEMTAPRFVLSAAICAGLLGLGVLGGILLDRIQAQQEREAVLGPYRNALTQRNRTLMKLELEAGGRHPAFAARWAATVAHIDDALRAGDPGVAVAAWRDAYREAVKSGRWDAMADVGDAALRIGEVREFRESPQAAARKSYLTALFRARAAGSLDGILRVADGFTALGDESVVRECLRVADGVVGSDADGRRRLVGYATRLAPLTESYSGVAY